MTKRLFAVLACGGLAACSGGGGATSQPFEAAPVSSPAAVAPASSTRVTFTMHWPSAAQSAKARSPLYVPSTAMSVGVAVNGGTPQYLNNPSTTLTIAADPGVDTFAFQTFDETNGQGNVLSKASITQTVVAGSANFVSAVLNGVIASLSASLASPTANAGTATTMAVNVTAMDADGNVIVGSDDYDRPIRLTIDDPEQSGALSLSSTLIQSPGTSVTMTYNGSTLTHADVAASANGVATVLANFNPTPTVYTFASTNGDPTLIRPGPNGTMVWIDEFNNAVGSIDATGKQGFFIDPTAGAGLLGVVYASDGRIYFSEEAVHKIASVTTSLTGYVEYPLASTLDTPAALIDHLDGHVYAADYNNKRLDSIALGGSSAAVDYPISGGLEVDALTNGPDNDIYFADSNDENVGMFNPLTSTTTDTSAKTYIGGLTAGPDGNIWYTGSTLSEVVKFAPGNFTPIATYPTLTPNETPGEITTGKDGALWYVTGGQTPRFGRVTTAGVRSEYAFTPSHKPDSFTFRIASSTDGSLWTCDGYEYFYRLVY